MIGKQLRKKRMIVGLSQSKLAERVGVTRQTIVNIENDDISNTTAIRVVEYELAKAFIEMTDEDLEKIIVVKA